MHNQYLPTELKDEVFLYKESDISDKLWDEEALKVWEREENDGKARCKADASARCARPILVRSKHRVKMMRRPRIFPYTSGPQR